MAFTFKHGDRPLDGYVIQRGVGRGGFGEVYYSLSDGGKEVALKYLRDNPQIELRGVAHCMNLKSPHLVTIYDVRQNAEGDHFIVMEYVNGPSLRDLLIAEPNGLGSQKAAFFISEIAKGLAYLHDRGIIHRDMKPGNIFYEDGYVKIGDYGLSKFISLSRHSGQTASIGTVHYMAPEVGSGNYHRGIDIYALGVMLYEMLLGRVPFEGSSMGEVLMKHLTEQPEVENLPAPFADVIRKALAKDPKDRYQTVHEMAEDLLGVEDVRKSIADFEPGSLTGIARQAMETQVMDSPHPSPHGGKAFNPAAAAAAQRRRDPQAVLDANTFSDRLAGRMERVAAKAGRAPKVKGFTPQEQAWAGGSESPLVAPSRMARLQGFVVSMIVALGLSVGAAIVIGGNERFFGNYFGVTFGFILALRLGIAVSAWVNRRMASPNPTCWVTGPITLACCVLPALMVRTIALDEGVPFNASALMAAVLAISAFVDWNRRARTGLKGHVEFKDAVKAGLFGMIAGAVFGDGDEDGPYMIMGAAIGAATSLSLQTGALFARRVPGGPGVEADPTKGKAAEPPSEDKDSAGFATIAIGIGGNEPQADAEAVGRTEPRTPGDPYGSGYGVQRRLRPQFFRVFWIVATLMMLTGAGVLALGTGLIAHGDEETMGFVIGLISCGLWSIFGMLKSTRYKRSGFWNETLRPLLTLMFMNGAAAIAMVIGFMNPRDEELFGLLAGLIPCGLFGLVCLFAGGRGKAHSVSEAPRGRSKWATLGSKWATLGSLFFSLVVSGVLTCGMFLLFAGPRSHSVIRTGDFVSAEAHAPQVFGAHELAKRVPALMGPPHWRPIAGLDGVSYRWQAVRGNQFQVIVRSDGNYGTKHLEFMAFGEDGELETEKFKIELVEGKNDLGPYRLEQIRDLRDVKVGFVRRR